MTLPPEHMKERLSISYVSAVAARAGVACRPVAPEYGTDAYLVRIKKINGQFFDTSFMICCQIKSTTTCEFRDGTVIYDMEAEAYNKLVEWEGASPAILVLFCLPPDAMEWLNLCEEELVIRRCCYWTQIKPPRTSNTSSIRIFIPRTQLFTPETIECLLEKVRRGEM